MVDIQPSKSLVEACSYRPEDRTWLSLEDVEAEYEGYEGDEDEEDENEDGEDDDNKL